MLLFSGGNKFCQVSNWAPQILCEAHFSPPSQCSPENYWAWKAFVVCIQDQGFSRFVDNMLNKMDWFVASDLLFYCLDFDLNIWFRVWNVTATFEKWAPGSKICIYHDLETPLSTHYKCFMLASFDQYMSTLHTCLLQTNKSIALHWATIQVNTHQVDLDQPVKVQLL